MEKIGNLEFPVAEECSNLKKKFDEVLNLHSHSVHTAEPIMELLVEERNLPLTAFLPNSAIKPLAHR